MKGRKPLTKNSLLKPRKNVHFANGTQGRELFFGMATVILIKESSHYTSTCGREIAHQVDSLDCNISLFRCNSRDVKWKSFSRVKGNSEGPHK